MEAGHMIAYIKDRKTFQTLDLMLELSQYNLILGAVNNNVGTALCSYEVEGLENQFFIFDNRLWIVKSLSPEDGHTLISLYDISYLFARDLIWDENNSYTTIEECIADTIDNEFINLSDTEYDTPYITVSYTTATPFIMPDTENGLWNLKAYIAKVRRVKNVFLDYTISRNDLLINIEQRTPTVWRFDFATDVAQMSQETYQKTSTAKITVNGTTDYYLYADGTYGNDPDLKDRAEGDWVQLQVSDNESEADKVADVFSKNSESRIIEFYTDAPVEFYDSVILRHEGRVTSGTLSTVSISSSDNRRYCKTGDLINTVPEAISVLSERIEKVTKTVERATEAEDGGNAPTLLWTNPSPTSTFSAQTVALLQDASNYDAFIVEMVYGNGVSDIKSEMVLNDGKAHAIICPRNANGSVYAIGWRSVTISGTQAVFSGGIYMSTTSGNANGQSIPIPWAIYGIQFRGPKGDRGPSGAAPVLLWTNTAPTSSFAAQTVAIDLTGYTMVYIE